MDLAVVYKPNPLFADVVELADTYALEAYATRRAGSSPVIGTT